MAFNQLNSSHGILETPEVIITLAYFFFVRVKKTFYITNVPPKTDMVRESGMKDFFGVGKSTAVLRPKISLVGFFAPLLPAKFGVGNLMKT